MFIEKGIPVHDPRGNANASRGKYPWEAMQIGDSFFAAVSPNALRTTAQYHARKTGRKFVVRKEGDGARAWRIA